MKRHCWLILALLALLGMIFVPGQAHSAPAVSLPGVSIRISPVTLVRLPVRPIPGPTVAGKPQIRLPSPQMPVTPVPTFETRVVVVAAAARPVAFETAARKAGVLGTARKMFEGPAGGLQASLDKAFDNTGPTEAPPVKVPREESSRITLPESDLEEEIGIR